MRELRVVGLDVDGKHIICESVCGDDERADMFRLRIDDRLRGAVRGEGSRVGQTTIDLGGTMLRPKDIQSRIRAGASVEQVAAAAGVDVSRVERFAHPVLLERSRAAELATAAHPVLADGAFAPLSFGAEVYGCRSIHTKDLKEYIDRYSIIINTAPAVLLDAETLERANRSSLVIDLASKPGGVDFETAAALGIRAVWLLSLPGKIAPLTAGETIGKTISNILAERNSQL